MECINICRVTTGGLAFALTPPHERVSPVGPPVLLPKLELPRPYLTNDHDHLDFLELPRLYSISQMIMIICKFIKFSQMPSFVLFSTDLSAIFL